MERRAPKRLDWYIGSLVVAAALALVVNATAADQSSGSVTPAFWMFAGGAAVGKGLLISAHRRRPSGDKTAVSLAGPFGMALVLIGPALFAVTIGSLAPVLSYVIRKRHLRKAIFNLAHDVLILSGECLFLHIGNGRSTLLHGGSPSAIWYVFAVGGASATEALGTVVLLGIVIAYATGAPVRNVVVEESSGSGRPASFMINGLAPVLVVAAQRSLTLVVVVALGIASIHLFRQAANGAKREAMLDPLTLLPNRRALDEHLAAAFSARRTGEIVGALILDLDGFKPVNDRLGHEAGDAILREVASRLRAACGSTDFVARTGGDEFTLLVASAPSQAVISDLARRCSSALEGLSAHGMPVTASIGMATCPMNTADAKELLRLADAAMYSAKRSPAVPRPVRQAGAY